ncbi:hypothetical protein [Niallia sp. MER 6]|uniref:hypothetical protein n=1 Tax=Niallia sp. MER 6 TaxID=2939567 RepID=UPI00203AF1EC|nr:hypothetical protein [Niallia sp. MER 6]MCM3029194.1 hypothetical protein [Niallia sp. MER 6]
MMVDLSLMPMPFFLINDRYSILARSNASKARFFAADSFLELVDLESCEKTIAFLTDSHGKTSMEANMKTSEGLALCQIQYTYDSANKHYYIVCHFIDSQYINLSYELNQLREALLKLQAGQDIKIMPPVLKQDKESLDHLQNLDTKKKLDKVKRSTSTIVDLLGVISPLIIEDGKGEYSEMIYDELYEIKSLVDEMKKALY